MKAVLIVLGVISLALVAQADLSTHEATAIRALIKAVPGLTSPLGVTHWDPATPEKACGFIGVTCDSDNTTVIELTIDEDTTGHLPPEIGNFHNMTRFILRRTSIGGPLPHTIKNWQKVEYFAIWVSEITGSVPDILAWPRLRVLRIDNSKLTGTLPEKWVDHKKVDHISLSNNLLHGGIPYSWSYFPALNYLDLSHNKLTGTIPGFLQARELITLALRDNHFHGSLPEELGQYITVIDFSSNQLSGTIPHWDLDSNEPSLLNLGNNSLTGTIPDFFEASDYWQEVDLSSNQLTGTIPPSLGSMDGLVLLYLEHNNLTLCPPPRVFLLSELYQTSCHLESQTVRAPCACMAAYQEAGCKYDCYV
jgi:Leucine-rich repeat (LRR) protein